MIFWCGSQTQNAIDHMHAGALQLAGPLELLLSHRTGALVPQAITVLPFSAARIRGDKSVNALEVAVTGSILIASNRGGSCGLV